MPCHFKYKTLCAVSRNHRRLRRNTRLLLLHSSCGRGWVPTVPPLLWCLAGCTFSRTLPCRHSLIRPHWARTNEILLSSSRLLTQRLSGDNMRSPLSLCQAGLNTRPMRIFCTLKCTWECRATISARTACSSYFSVVDWNPRRLRIQISGTILFLVIRCRVGSNQDS